MFKGGILHEWKKKMAIALDRPFFENLPDLQTVERDVAEVAWLVYDLVFDEDESRYRLQNTKVIYTLFLDTLNRITRAKVGRVDDFLRILQEKVDEKLETPPITNVLETPFTRSST